MRALPRNRGAAVCRWKQRRAAGPGASAAAQRTEQHHAGRSSSR
eukprot:COSAG06_NODE_43264_length_373_cov_1.503650_1_plen_43_part_01